MLIISGMHTLASHYVNDKYYNSFLPDFSFDTFDTWLIAAPMILSIGEYVRYRNYFLV